MTGQGTGGKITRVTPCYRAKGPLEGTPLHRKVGRGFKRGYTWRSTASTYFQHDSSSSYATGLQADRTPPCRGISRVLKGSQWGGSIPPAQAALQDIKVERCVTKKVHNPMNNPTAYVCSGIHSAKTKRTFRRSWATFDGSYGYEGHFLARLCACSGSRSLVRSTPMLFRGLRALPALLYFLRRESAMGRLVTLRQANRLKSFRPQRGIVTRASGESTRQ